ncbi:carboxypeptidase-like regulatory domain-containing protein, partial [Fervidibacter sacchari]
MAYTDEQGNFTFENLRPGEYWLVAFGKDFRNQLRKNIVVEAGKTTE